jgi:methyl-accepting chemotaxis protein
MTLNNLRLRTRLTVGFGMIASMMLFGTLLALYCLTALDGSVSNRLAEASKMQTIQHLEAEVYQEYLDVWNLVSDADVNAKSAHREKMNRARESRQKRLAELKAVAKTEEGRRLLTELEAVFSTADKINNHILSTLGRAENERSSTSAMAEADAARQRIGTAIQNIIEWREKRIKEMGTTSTTVLSRARVGLSLGAGIGIAVALVFGWAITRSVTQPLGLSMDLLNKVSGGDVSHNVPHELTSRQDEAGDLGRSIQAMTENLRSLLRKVSGGVQTLASSATELSAVSSQTALGVKSISEKTGAVAAAAEEASANTSSVAAGMEQAATNLSSVASATEEMSATVGEISSNSEKARVISEQATLQAQSITVLVKQLGEAAREIGKVTETITDISSQTNLLALNATIEAARAGAAGKGFAVVANEIKELARQTATATEDIKAKIGGVQSTTGSAISDIEKIAQVIREVGSIVATIAAAIEEQATVTKDVAGNIAQASAGVKDSNERVAQTATVSRTIAQDVASISSVVNDVRQGGEQVEASAAELSRLAEGLKETVNQFRV